MNSKNILGACIAVTKNRQEATQWSTPEKKNKCDQKLDKAAFSSENPRLVWAQSRRSGRRSRKKKPQTPIGVSLVEDSRKDIDR